MANYILEGWGDKGLWVLNNATWVIWGGDDCLKTGNGVSGGYGEREVNALNKDWELTIYWTVEDTPLNPRGIDYQIFLDGDPKPIIFRISFDDPGEDDILYSIIYDGDVKDSRASTMDEFYSGIPTSFKIYRTGSIYYFTSFGLSFNYGSKKKPVKLKLANYEKNYNTHWYTLSWYYTEAEQDYAFIM